MMRVIHSQQALARLRRVLQSPVFCSCLCPNSQRLAAELPETMSEAQGWCPRFAASKPRAPGLTKYAIQTIRLRKRRAHRKLLKIGL